MIWRFFPLCPTCRCFWHGRWRAVPLPRCLLLRCGTRLCWFLVWAVRCYAVLYFGVNLLGLPRLNGTKVAPGGAPNHRYQLPAWLVPNFSIAACVPQTIFKTKHRGLRRIAADDQLPDAPPARGPLHGRRVLRVLVRLPLTADLTADWKNARTMRAAFSCYLLLLLLSPCCFQHYQC
jgi:hypothetical protein